MVEEQQEPGRWRSGAIALVVIAVVLIGVIAGYIISGGLEDPEAGSTSTTSTPPQVTTTLPPPVTTTESVTTTAVAVSPSPTVPPDTSVEGEVTFTATEDTFVDVTETAPLGNELFLSVEDEPPELQQALIRFEVVGIPDGAEIESAVLELFVEEPADEPVNVFSVVGDWTETDTTVDDAPMLGEAIASFQPETALSRVEVDVTDVVEGNGVVDFYLAATSPRTATFASRESVNPPVLVVRWG